MAKKTVPAEDFESLLQSCADDIRSKLSVDVQIVATWVDDDGDTQKLAVGSGNLYARIGATSEWADENLNQMMFVQDDEDV